VLAGPPPAGSGAPGGRAEPPVPVGRLGQPGDDHQQPPSTVAQAQAVSPVRKERPVAAAVADPATNVNGGTKSR
jgi:hypothetical protein